MVVANGGGPGLVKNVGFTVWGLETAGSYAYFVQNGNTYWQTDGTSAGTVRLTSPGGAMFAPSADMTALGAKMLFRGSTTLNSNDELWITADPRNTASRRSCELAGARFIEIVDLPVGCEMYEAGDRQRCRFHLAVKT